MFICRLYILYVYIIYICILHYKTICWNSNQEKCYVNIAPPSPHPLHHIPPSHFSSQTNLSLSTVGEYHIGAPKREIILVLLNCPFFPYRNCKIGIFSSASCKVVTLYLLCLIFGILESKAKSIWTRKSYSYSCRHIGEFNTELMYKSDTKNKAKELRVSTIDISKL